VIDIVPYFNYQAKFSGNIHWASSTILDGTSAVGDGKLKITDAAGTSGYILSVGGASGMVLQTLAGGGGSELIAGGIRDSVQGAFRLNGTLLSLSMRNDFILNWSSTAGYGGAKDIGLARASAGILKVTDGSSGGGAVQIGDPGARPACDATTRGTFWIDEGGAGVKDTVDVCAKDAVDAYAWRNIY